MSNSWTPALLKTRQEDTAAEVRGQAAEILAAFGVAKLREIALFRATKWADISTNSYLDDRDYADIQWARAAEWLRIGWTLSDPMNTAHSRSAAFRPTTRTHVNWSPILSNSTEQLATDDAATPTLFASSAEFTELVAEMVADQAPRVFAVVLEYGQHADAQVAAWGMALDDGAYMTTVDGRTQYSLARPENAVKYVRDLPNTTPHLVWAEPANRGSRE